MPPCSRNRSSLAVRSGSSRSRFQRWPTPISAHHRGLDPLVMRRSWNYSISVPPCSCVPNGGPRRRSWVRADCEPVARCGAETFPGRSVAYQTAYQSVRPRPIKQVLRRTLATLSAAVKRGRILADTEEVTGSNPVSPTSIIPGQTGFATASTPALLPCRGLASQTASLTDQLDGDRTRRPWPSLHGSTPAEAPCDRPFQ